MELFGPKFLMVMMMRREFDISDHWQVGLPRSSMLLGQHQTPNFLFERDGDEDDGSDIENGSRVANKQYAKGH